MSFVEHDGALGFSEDTGFYPPDRQTFYQRHWDGGTAHEVEFTVKGYDHDPHHNIYFGAIEATSGYKRRVRIALGDTPEGQATVWGECVLG